jgi:hypothetical protein
MTNHDPRALNDNNQPRWTSERWALHLRDHHPAHAAASFAKHREEMGRLAPAARVITALSMEGKTWAKGDALPLSFDQALARIDEACARREGKRAA